MKGNNKLCMSVGVLCDLLFGGVKSGYFRDVFFFFFCQNKFFTDWQLMFLFQVRSTFIIIFFFYYYYYFLSARVQCITLSNASMHDIQNTRNIFCWCDLSWVSFPISVTRRSCLSLYRGRRHTQTVAHQDLSAKNLETDTPLVCCLT